MTTTRIADAARAFVAAYDALDNTGPFGARQRHIDTFDAALAELRAALTILTTPRT